MSNETLLLITVFTAFVGFAWALSYALRDDEPPVKKHS